MSEEMISMTSSGDERRNWKLKGILMAVVVIGSLLGAGIVKKRNPSVGTQSRFVGPHGGRYTCSVGMFIDPSGCLYCPKGNLCDQVDLASPKQCGVGTYQDKIGQKACPVAPAGTYADQKGMILPVKCSPGSFQPNAGQTTCILASPGTFVPTSGQTMETNCLPQFYQPKSGQTKCLPCPAGEVQPLPGQSSCMCAASNTTAMASSVRTNTLAKLTHLSRTGCPGSMFLRGGLWYVGSPRTCVSGRVGIGGRPPKVSSLVMVTALATSYSERPEYRMYQSGNNIYVQSYYCNYQGSCRNVANWNLNNQNLFHLAFPSNGAHKQYTAMVPSYAQALSWAKQGYAPAFRMMYSNDWHYFDYMTAMSVEEPGRSKKYTFFGTFPNQYTISHNVRYEIHMKNGKIIHCCRIYSGAGRSCTGVNGRVNWYTCREANIEFRI